MHVNLGSGSASPPVQQARPLPGLRADRANEALAGYREALAEAGCCRDGAQGAGGGNAADGAPLSGEEAVARFCDHLASEMGASGPYGARAYREDMEAYLCWAQRAGVDPLLPPTAS